MLLAGKLLDARAGLRTVRFYDDVAVRQQWASRTYSRFEKVRGCTIQLNCTVPVVESYRSLLVDGQLRRVDEVPDAIRRGSDELRVRATIEEAGEQDGDDRGGAPR